MNTSLILQPGATPKAKSWLYSRRGIFALLVLVGIVALGSGWYWLGFAAIAPVFYLLPCAIMMAMCAKGMSHGHAQGAEAGKKSGAAPKKPGNRL